jgi:hypothetical protein
VKDAPTRAWRLIALAGPLAPPNGVSGEGQRWQGSGDTRASNSPGYYPWRCLCLGSFLQMTITTPWRRITLQLSQRGFTDARTFTLRLLT